MNFHTQISTERAQDRADAIAYAIEQFNDQAAYHADVLLDELVRTGCMPFGFGGVERNALIKAAGKAARDAVLERANIPGGVAL